MAKFIEVVGDKTALIERGLALVKEKIELSIQERGLCTIALAGGSTPKPLYERLANQSLTWDKIQVFWGDERYVPPTHPDSNQKMARLAWLDSVNIPPSNIHPMPTNAGNPIIDAQTYDNEIRSFFAVNEPEIPIFDIILLGMGDDGHTASLFPHTEALQVKDSLITVGKKDGQPRLTFTVPLINQARCVIFLVAGSNKQAALDQIFAPIADANNYPSRLIQPQGELWWLLDNTAGAKVIID